MKNNWIQSLFRGARTAKVDINVLPAHAQPRKRIITLRRLLMTLLLVALALLLGLGLPNLIVNRYASTRLYSPANVPNSGVAIVFGAGLLRNGTPSPVLRDRVETAARLYLAGKVDRILMSGDNRFIYYNEPGAMHDYAVGLGVPEEAIVLDYAGRRTYDTCYRARFIFGVREAVLVTQDFHIARALYTCNILGISALGVPAEIRTYLRRSRAIWYAREVPATAIAVWEVWVARPLPVLGRPEPIYTGTEQPRQFDWQQPGTTHTGRH